MNLTIPPTRPVYRCGTGLASITLILFLSACSTVEDWISPKEGPPLEGDRIAILTHNRSLTADKELANQRILLPAPTPNATWPQAGGYANHAMHHIEIKDSLARAWSVDIGSGTDEEERLNAQPIVAAGMGTLELTDLDLRCVQGQSVVIRAKQGLPEALTGDLNITALGDNRFLVGSTYRLDDSNPKPTPANTQRLNERLSEFLGHTRFEVMSEHAGVRVAYPDRKIGFGSISPSNLAQPPKHGAPFEVPYPRLYALTGLGSHGLTHAPLAAEAIISSIVGAPSINPRRHLQTFKPDRAQRQP